MTPLRFNQRLYKIIPDFRLLLTIEEELGALAALNAAFSGDGWRVSELVTLTHMFLAAAGLEIDFMELGAKMLAEGIGGYLATARKFLSTIIEGDKKA